MTTIRFGRRAAQVACALGWLAISQAQLLDIEVALLAVGLDDLKTISQSLGHQSGELYLKVIAQRISALVGARGTVARSCVDELLVIQPLHGTTSVDELAAQLLACAGDPVAIGPYTVLCRLPRGGQGADVFVARSDDETAQLVVIKCLPADAGELTRRRFAREVENAARIVSPRVARIVGQDLEGKSPYYVQEYVQGLPLDEWLAQRERSGLNAEELRRIAIGLLRAASHRR